MNIKDLAVMAVATAFMAIAGPAGAITVTACGPTVCYEYDDAQAAVAWTGLPTLVGDDMRFTPGVFRAQSNGAGFDMATANFIFDSVWTPGGQEIVSLTTIEEFDYQIINDGGVQATLYMQARSNVDSRDGISDLWNLSFNGDSGGQHIASLTGSLLPAASFNHAAANDMLVTIQNTLLALADPGELAWIQKKFTLVTTVVPVPAAVWLLGSGLGVLGFLRRQRSPA